LRSTILPETTRPAANARSMDVPDSASQRGISPLQVGGFSGAGSGSTHFAVVGEFTISCDPKPPPRFFPAKPGAPANRHHKIETPDRSRRHRHGCEIERSDLVSRASVSLMGRLFGPAARVCFEAFRARPNTPAFAGADFSREQAIDEMLRRSSRFGRAEKLSCQSRTAIPLRRERAQPHACRFKCFDGSTPGSRFRGVFRGGFNSSVVFPGRKQLGIGEIPAWFFRNLPAISTAPLARCAEPRLGRGRLTSPALSLFDLAGPAVSTPSRTYSPTSMHVAGERGRELLPPGCRSPRARKH